MGQPDEPPVDVNSYVSSLDNEPLGSIEANQKSSESEVISDDNKLLFNPSKVSPNDSNVLSNNGDDNKVEVVYQSSLLRHRPEEYNSLKDYRKQVCYSFTCL